MTASVPTPLPLRPELSTKYAAFYAALVQGHHVPRRTLELCRKRIAAIQDCAAEWSIDDPDVPLSASDLDCLRRASYDTFEPGERAALMVAEKISFQHHQISDAEVEDVRANLGESGTVTLLTALGFFDVNCRLRLATAGLFN
jgi:alkylhydroperoxidase family enzyme